MRARWRTYFYKTHYVCPRVPSPPSPLRPSTGATWARARARARRDESASRFRHGYSRYSLMWLPSIEYSHFASSSLVDSSLTFNTIADARHYPLNILLFLLLLLLLSFSSFRFTLLRCFFKFSPSAWNVSTRKNPPKCTLLPEKQSTSRFCVGNICIETRVIIAILIITRSNY